MIGIRCLLEISRDSGNVTEEAVVCHDERAPGETGLNGDKHVMSVDGKELVSELSETQQLPPPGLGVRVREDTTMKEMTLVKGEPISVSHEL